MKSSSFFLILLPLALAISWLVASSQTAKSSPPKRESEVSSPLPPTKRLTAPAVLAISDLFDAGLPDPTGCEYREIAVAVGSREVKTHGWIIPSDDLKKFAICWDGLIYPVALTGAEADYKKDISEVLARDKAKIDKISNSWIPSEKQREAAAIRAGEKYQRPAFPLRWEENPTGIGDIRIMNLSPLQAAFLFRLGQEEWAQQIWNQWFGDQGSPYEKDPFLVLAEHWTWSLFDRSLYAHIRGDDRSAESDTKTLAAIRKALETIYRKRLNSTEPNENSPAFTFLSPLDELLADTKRRLKEPAYTPVLESSSIPVGKVRISGLIRDLEQASNLEISLRGENYIAEDPIVQALILCGDEAVEPLLHALENDTRLTRAVYFKERFGRERIPWKVSDAICVALSGILQTDAFRTDSGSGRYIPDGHMETREVAKRIRSYWQQTRGLSPAEQWFQGVADDHATPSQWIESSQKIVQQEKKTSSKFPTLKGESLRSKTNPSLSDLLIKRIQKLTTTKTAQDTQWAVTLALILAKWDAKAGAPVLYSLSQTFKNNRAIAEQYPGGGGAAIVSLYEARLAIGDSRALIEYAEWIVNAPRGQVDFEEAFTLMWKNPNDLMIRKASEKLFTDPHSPWVPLLRKGFRYPGDLLHSPLVGLTAFRQELFRGLKDKREVGSVQISQAGYANASVDHGWTGSTGEVSATDPLAPAKGAFVVFRNCDLYAYQVSAIQGAPKCQLYWPEPERDKAVQACVEFLQKYGDLLQFQTEDTEEWSNSGQRAHLHLPHPERPATE